MFWKVPRNFHFLATPTGRERAVGETNVPRLLAEGIVADADKRATAVAGTCFRSNRAVSAVAVC